MNKKKLKALPYEEKERLYKRYEYLLIISSHKEFFSGSRDKLLVRIKRFWHSLEERERRFIIYKIQTEKKYEQMRTFRNIIKFTNVNKL